jgi:hypothetical protein
MNLSRYRNVAITLAGAAIFVVLSDLVAIARSGLFEVDRPTLFARLETLWSLMLFVVPGVAVGFYVTKRAAAFGAAAYVLGELIAIYRSNWFGYRAVGDFLPERQFLLYALRGVLIMAAIGVVMGWTAAKLRQRLTIGWSDRRAVSSIDQGEGR